MLPKHLSQEILNTIEYEPTGNQVEAIKAFSDFFFDTEQRILIINGYAGTGKTTLVKLFVEVLRKYRYPYVLLAPTGRAAKVLSNYCQSTAYTIHKYIYRQLSADNFKFVLNFNTQKNTIFFIDESSLISNEAGEFTIFGSGRLLDDLQEFVFSSLQNKLVFIGDTAQLPPVGSSFHPALAIETFQSFHIPTRKIEIKEVVRQQMESLINVNATTLRHHIENGIIEIPFFKQKDKEFLYISSSESLEYLSSSYDSVGLDETIVLCYSNKRALQFNKAIRSRIFYYEEEVVRNELLMVVKNNYFTKPANRMLDFIANGEMIYVRQMKKHEEMYGFKFLTVSAELSNTSGGNLESCLMLDTLYSEAPSLSREKQEELYKNVMQDYISIKSKRKRMSMMRENPYFNALQVKYAYAVTTHKAQGGQWKHVYIDASFFRYVTMGVEQLKWLYTAITRATEKVYIIDMPSQFAENFTNHKFA